MVAAENDFSVSVNHLPIRLYFQDEAQFGRINTLQKCWCLKGVIPTAPQQVIREFTFVFTAACPETGKTCSLILPRADTETMNLFLLTLSEQQSDERIIVCMDRAGWHTTQQLVLPENIIVWFLPPYSPELNPVELIWRELRAKYFNNKLFNTLDEVDSHLMFAITDFTADKERLKKLTKINYL